MKKELGVNDATLSLDKSDCFFRCKSHDNNNHDNNHKSSGGSKVKPETRRSPAQEAVGRRQKVEPMGPNPKPGLKIRLKIPRGLLPPPVVVQNDPPTEKLAMKRKDGSTENRKQGSSDGQGTSASSNLKIRLKIRVVRDQESRGAINMINGDDPNKLARKEDEEQLRLIRYEEKMRRAKKRRVVRYNIRR